MGYVWATLTSMGVILSGAVMIVLRLYTIGVYCAIIGFLVVCFASIAHYIKYGA